MNGWLLILLIRIFSYLIENEVCYLVLCERNWSKRLAYSYLEDIAQEFHAQYGKRVNTVTRPYTFIEFGNFLNFLAQRKLFRIAITKRSRNERFDCGKY